MATAVTEVQTHLPASPPEPPAEPLLRHVAIALSFLLLMTAGQYVVSKELADIFDPDAYGLVQIVFQIGMLAPMLFGLQLTGKGHEAVEVATAVQCLWRLEEGTFDLVLLDYKCNGQISGARTTVVVAVSRFIGTPSLR